MRAPGVGVFVVRHSLDSEQRGCGAFGAGMLVGLHTGAGPEVRVLCVTHSKLRTADPTCRGLLQLLTPPPLFP